MRDDPAEPPGSDHPSRETSTLARSLAHSRLTASARGIRSSGHQHQFVYLHGAQTTNARSARRRTPTHPCPRPASPLPILPFSAPSFHPRVQRARACRQPSKGVRASILCVDTRALPPLPLSTPARTPRMRVHSMDRSIPTLSPAHTNTPRLRARHASYQASARPSAPPSAKNRSVPRRPPQQSAGWRRRRAQRPSAFGAGHRERKRGWRRRTCLVHPRARAAGASSRSTRPRVSCCAPSQSRARPTTLLGGFDAHALPPRASPLTSQSRPIGDGRRARF